MPKSLGRRCNAVGVLATGLQRRPMDARPSWSSSRRLRFASRRLRHHHRPGPRTDPAGIVGGVAQMGLERESGPWLASSRWPPTPTSILTGCSVLRLEGVPNLSTSPENEAIATVKSRPSGQTGMGGLSGGLGVGTPPGHRGRWRRSRRSRRDPRTRRPPDSSRPRHPCFQRPSIDQELCRPDPETGPECPSTARA